MGSKFPVVSLLLFLLCLPAAFYISQYKLPELRKEQYKGIEAQLGRLYLPVLGIDKFYADTQWVQIIQDMAKHSTQGVTRDKDGNIIRPEISEEEREKQQEEQARYFYDRFQRLSDLDPNNENYYIFAARALQNDLPNEAIALLKKGEEMLRSPSYEYPYLQYHIINNVVAFNDDSKKKAMSKELSELLKRAMNRPNSPAHIQGKWLRTEAQRQNLGDDEVGRLNLWARYYLQSTSREGIEAGGIDSTGQSDLRQQVMGMAQEMAIDIWEKKKTASDEEKKKLDEKLAKVSKIFKSVAPAGHYSPVSLMPYAPGDLFDAQTGTPVKPYGVNPELLKKGIVVVYKGPFCHVTGQPRVEDQPEE